MCDLDFRVGCGRPFLSFALGWYAGFQVGLLLLILLEFVQPVSVSASEFSSQFKLPPTSNDGGPSLKLLPKRLLYQYGYGSDSEIEYKKNPDLNSRAWDHSLIIKPEFNGYIVYRPTDWIETSLEGVIERAIPLAKEHPIFISDEEVIYPTKHKIEARMEQAYLRFKKIGSPLELTVGRQIFEDDRHWLYDTALDAVTISLKGKIQADFSAGREILVDMDTSKEKPDRIDTYITYVEYRGIEYFKLAGYSIFRYDKDRAEGRPRLFGTRLLGSPNLNFKYWTEWAYLSGHDDLLRDFDAYALDMGGVYWLEGLLLDPFLILDFAYATGDDPKDNKNQEFRQSGLQSNEVKFTGIPQVRMYGEALDPELSNLRVITAGLGFRVGTDVTVDFIFHRYRLNQLAEEIRGAQLTALLNQDPSQLTRDVGSALDVGLGIRDAFGIRRFGIEIRAGLFFPGPAHRSFVLSEDGDEAFFPADKGLSVLTKFGW